MRTSLRVRSLLHVLHRACADMRLHAAFERAVLASKSYLIALGLVEGFLSVDEAAKAAHVEVQSQIDRWGEVEDSECAHIVARLRALTISRRQPTTSTTETFAFA